MAQTHYTAFTVQTGQVTGTLTDFPMLIKPPNTTRFKLVANGGHVANGNDLRAYSNAAMTTTLPCELVPGSYDGSATGGTFEMWVKVPAQVGYAVYVGYGDTALTTPPTGSAAWNSNYKAVFHLSDNAATTTVLDSTANGFNATAAANTSGKSVAGKIGNALSFNGSTDQAVINTGSNTLDHDFTVSAWAYTAVTTETKFIGSRGGSDQSFDAGLKNGDTAIGDVGSGSEWMSFASGSFSYSVNTWYHFAWTVKYSTGLSEMFGYANGALISSTEPGSNKIALLYNSTHLLTIGGYKDGGAVQQWNGRVEEVHVSDVVRSPDWIAAEYRNQNAPTSFSTMEAEDTPSGGVIAPTISSMTPSSANSNSLNPVTLTAVAFVGTGLDGTGGAFSAAGFTFSALSIASGGASGTVNITIAAGKAAGVYAFSYTTTGGTSSGTASFNFTISTMVTAHFGYTFVDSESITMMAAGALSLENQPVSWLYWNTPDSPEGAWNSYGHGNVDAVLALPTTLVPGTYYVFIFFMDFGGPQTVTATVGATTSSAITSGYTSATEYWQPRMTLTTAASSSSMTIHFAAVGTTDYSRVLRGVYITSNANVTILADGTAVNLTPPTVMDDSAPVKGNLFANSSFELGLDAAWFQHADRQALLSASAAHSGAQGIRIPLDESIGIPDFISSVYHLKPNKSYTFSAWMKCDFGTPGVNFRMANTFVPPTGYDPRYVVEQLCILTPSWQRFSVTGYLKAYPTSDFQFEFQRAGNVPSPGNHWYIDDIQLEEGGLSTYAPASAIETMVVIDSGTKPGNIYYQTDAKTALLKAWNTTSASKTGALQYEIYDYLNRVVRSGSVSLSLTAGQQTSTSFDISTTGLTGAFRLRYWVDGDPVSEKELNYCIIPPVTAGLDLSSYMGIHSHYSDIEMRTHARLGIKWNRDLSPASTTRWVYAEPTDDAFVYFDWHTAAATAANIAILSTIGYETPTWALTGAGGTPNLTEWSEFVTTMVNHYKASIHYWEIWNEPLAQYTPAVYAGILKTAADAIEAADSTGKIVGMGGMGSQAQIDSVLAALASAYPTWDWKTHLDAISVHIYPGATPGGFAGFITANGVPFWNTETGYWTFGPYTGPYANWQAWGKQVLPFYDASRFYREYTDGPARVVENFVSTIAGRQTKYFYYDGRLAASPGYARHHPTILEYDGSIRVKGVAYAIAGSFIDHATSTGNNSPDANSQFLPFTTSAAPVAMLYSSDGKPRQVVLGGTVTNAQLALYDLMGNPATFTGTTIQYGRIPVYLKGVGITAATLSGALAGGTVTLRADTAAPHLAIMAGPRGAIAAAPFRMRWLALDEISFPNYGEYNLENNTPGDEPAPAAIEYAYRLMPDTTWSQWAAITFVDYPALAAGSYTFEVKSRDAALNESAVVQRALTVAGGGGTAPAPTITTLRPTSAIPNPVVPIVLQGVQIAGTALNQTYLGGPSVITFSNSNVTISGTPTRTATLITMDVGITAGAAPNAGTVSVQTDGGTVATGFIVSPTPSGS